MGINSLSLSQGHVIWKIETFCILRHWESFYPSSVLLSVAHRGQDYHHLAQGVEDAHIEDGVKLPCTSRSLCYLCTIYDVTNEGVCQYRPRYRSCVGQHSEGMEHNTGVCLREIQDIVQKQHEDGSHAIVGEPLTEFCGQYERDGFGIGDFGLGRHCKKFKSLGMGRYRDTGPD